MHSSARGVAIGVDLGSSTTTVSTLRDDERTRDVRRTPTGPAPEAPGPERSGDGKVLIGLAVPATWSLTRCRAHSAAAANAGFEASFLVSEPEAAARRFAEARGRPLEPDAPLVVCNLGAASCHAAVVRREGDRYRTEAAKSTDDVGGRAFDKLLLDHLARRCRSTDPGYWARLRNPGETALRADALEAVREARERLSDQHAAAVALPGLDRELRLTREDADQCLTPGVLRTVDLIEDAMREAGAETDRIAGLLLIGGASRTPLVADVVRHHLGVEPEQLDPPDLVIAEGAALAGLARLGVEEAEPPPRKFTRLRTSSDVIVTMLVVVIAVAALTGVVLVNRGGAQPQDLDADSAPPSPPGLSEPDGTEAETTPDAAAPTPEAGTSESAPGETEVDVPSASPTPVAPAVPAGDPGTTAESGIAVPDVTGMLLADAEQALTEAGFTEVTSDGERLDSGSPDSDVPAYDRCEVRDQTPEPGTRGPADTPITLTYVYWGSGAC